MPSAPKPSPVKEDRERARRCRDTARSYRAIASRLSDLAGRRSVLDTATHYERLAELIEPRVEAARGSRAAARRQLAGGNRR